MKKKLIIINGVMGVGKTTVSKKLYKSLPNSFWLDGDNCWMMNPFEVNEENKKMVLDNITYILNNFLNNTWSKYIIFNWVIHLDDIMNEILNRFHRGNVEIYKITLTCSEEELIKRIKEDIKCGKRDVDNIDRSLERLRLYANMDTTKIDTTNKDIDIIVEEIEELLDK